MDSKHEDRRIERTLTDIDGLLIDLDDTLFLEHGYVLSGIRAVAAFLSEKGHHPLDAEGLGADLSYRFLKYGRIGLFDPPVKACPAITISEVVEVYRGHRPEIDLLPGVGESLVALRRHFRLALVTDGNADMQRNKIAALGLEPMMDCIVLCDELGAPKPDPRGFLHAAEQLGIPPGRALVIGDDPRADLQAAVAASMRAIRVRSGRFGLLDASGYGYPEVSDFVEAGLLLDI